MTVRAKFKVVRVESSMGSKRNAAGTYEQVEMRTVVLNPVYSDKEGSENKTFWDTTPAGEIRLGTINPSAWAPFALDGEFYVDFTPAAPPA